MQRDVIATLDDFALLQDENVIAIHNCTQTMRDDEICSSLRRKVDSDHDLLLSVRI